MSEDARIANVSIKVSKKVFDALRDSAYKKRLSVSKIGGDVLESYCIENLGIELCQKVVVKNI